MNIHDPFIDDGDLVSFMMRAAHEQFPFQDPWHNDLARTQALLVDAAASHGSSLITPSFWHSLLGCTTQQLFGVALMMNTAAVENGGVFSPTWLDQANFKPVFEILPRAAIDKVFSTHFCMDIDRHRSTQEPDPPQGDLERYAFNSLRVAPFVTDGKLAPIAPVPDFAWHRATPASLYFTAVKAYGSAFTAELGAVFQHYVGQQLGLACDQVLPEIVYDSPEGERRSVDFIMVFPQSVILVEAKATPMRANSRRGSASLQEDIDRAPGKALGQIAETFRLIRDRHSAFTHVPHDRRFIGLVVTMEPYYLLSLPFASVPTWLASARDLELIVTCTTMQLDEALSTPQRPGFTSHLNGIPQNMQFGRNTILDAAWNKLPFAAKSGDTLATDANPLRSSQGET